MTPTYLSSHSVLRRHLAVPQRLGASLLLLCTLCVSLFSGGCNKHAATSAQPEKPRALRIGMSFQELDNPYFAVMKQALDEAGRSLGAELYVTDARHDVTKQLSDVEDLIQKGIDILLINPTDSVGVESAVRDAKKAGVVVVAVDAQANGPVDSFVGSKNYDAGFLAGEQLAKVLGGRGKVAILDGIPVVPILERVRGFKAAVAKHPEIQIVDVQNGKQERSAALAVTENMIQSHPDLNGLFSVNDGGALGALAAIKASNKNIALVSVDGLAEVVDAVVKGDVFKATVAQFPRDQVRIALGIALARRWGAQVPAVVPIDVKLLTPENARGFAW
jgi:ribose transport system substrate-binding protein